MPQLLVRATSEISTVDYLLFLLYQSAATLEHESNFKTEIKLSNIVPGTKNRSAVPTQIIYEVSVMNVPIMTIVMGIRGVYMEMDIHMDLHKWICFPNLLAGRIRIEAASANDKGECAISNSIENSLKLIKEQTC